MKRYIFLSYDIHMMGGCQSYISGKSAYLEKNGWTVYVLFSGEKGKDTYPFPRLKKYADGSIPEIEYPPSEMFGVMRDVAIKNMLSVACWYHPWHP